MCAHLLVYIIGLQKVMRLSDCHLSKQSTRRCAHELQEKSGGPVRPLLQSSRTVKPTPWSANVTHFRATVPPTFLNCAERPYYLFWLISLVHVWTFSNVLNHNVGNFNFHFGWKTWYFPPNVTPRVPPFCASASHPQMPGWPTCGSNSELHNMELNYTFNAREQLV